MLHRIATLLSTLTIGYALALGLGVALVLIGVWWLWAALVAWLLSGVTIFAAAALRPVPAGRKPPRPARRPLWSGSGATRRIQ